MTINSANKMITEQGTASSGASRTIIGNVMSSKMNKTIVVQMERMVKHPIYGKYMRRFSRMYVHDEENKCQEGDVVKIKQTRPVSKLKRWVLVEIVRRAEHVLDNSKPASEESGSEENLV